MAVTGLGYAAICAAVVTAPVQGQLPPVNALELGRAGQASPGSEIGFPTSPAALAGRPGWAVTALPFIAGAGLGPITGRDLVRANGEFLPLMVREAWLQTVTEAGSQRGRITVAVTPLAARIGPVSLQLSTVGVGTTRLPPDAVELLLFGNAGRTGEPADLNLRGAALDGALISTLGVGWGLQLRPELSVGLRGHLSVGHAVLVARDAGSLFEGAGAEAMLRLPTLSGTGITGPGFGVGVDAGARWVTERTATEITVLNAGSTFSWSPRALEWRAGETLIRGNGVESDFGPRPAQEAPLLLRAALGDLVPAPRLEAEHVYRLSGSWSLRGVVREVLGAGLDMGRPPLRAVGAEWSTSYGTPSVGEAIAEAGAGATGPDTSALPPLTLAAHLGSITGDPQLGVGGRLVLGSWVVSGGWEHTRGEQRPGSRYALSITFLGGRQDERTQSPH